MTLGPDLLLDPDTHDLDIQESDLLLDTDVAQAVSIRLQFFRNEWFLNRDAGVPYYEDIFIKNPNLDQISAIYRRTILDTPGVGELLSFIPDFDADTRVYSLEWSANTDDGEISGVEEMQL